MAGLWCCRAQVSERCVKDKARGGPVCRMHRYDADVDMQEEDKAEVLKQEGPMDLIQDAIDACPMTCIEWIPPEELNEAHSAGGVVAK